MKIIFIELVILFLFYLIIYFLPIIPTSSHQGPVSDHFDGKRFYNPDHHSKKSILAILKWLFSRHAVRWPAHVANEPYSADTQILSTNQIKVTFVNHSTLLLQTSELNILTDPIWSYRASPFAWFGPARVRDPGIPFVELPFIHLVLISHNHYDHLDIPTLQKLEEKYHPIFLVPLGDKTLLTKQGISNVIELDWWQQYTLKNTVITFLPTQHWSARWLADKYKTLWGSFGIEMNNKKLYFAGDAGYSIDFKTIRSKWGSPDLAFLSIGSYMPQWFMQEFHLNPDEAVRAHLDLGSRKSIAIHYGTFQLSDEGINQPMIDLHQAIKKYSLLPEQFIILPEGKSFILE